MYLKWGSHQFQSRKTWLDWAYQPVVSPRGFLMFYRVNARFGGTVSITTGDDINDLEDLIVDTEAAMLIPNQDFALYHESNTIAKHAISASDTMDGTRMQFAWLKGSGRVSRGNSNEYVNLRSFQGMVSYELEANEEDIPIWQERLTQFGSGNSEIVVKESLTGFPIGQTVQAATAVTIVQEGTAIGWDGYPSFPASVAPSAFRSKAAVYERGAPTYGRYLTRMYPIRWRYTHELIGAPASPLFPTDPPI